MEIYLLSEKNVSSLVERHAKIICATHRLARAVLLQYNNRSLVAISHTVMLFFKCFMILFCGFKAVKWIFFALYKTKETVACLKFGHYFN